MQIWVSEAGRPSLVHIMACHLLDTKPWLKPVSFKIGQLDINFSEILRKNKHFHSRNCISKCHLQNGSHIVLGLNVSMRLWNKDFLLGNTSVMWPFFNLMEGCTEWLWWELWKISVNICIKFNLICKTWLWFYRGLLNFGGCLEFSCLYTITFPTCTLIIIILTPTCVLLLRAHGLDLVGPHTASSMLIS